MFLTRRLPGLLLRPAVWRRHVASSAGAAVAAATSSRRPAYLDLQATTPLDPRVLDAMLPYQVERYGNPHSRTHAYGWEAEAAVNRAREHVARLVQAESPQSIIFTSGATESNNLALKGVLGYRAKQQQRQHQQLGGTAVPPRKLHLITTQIEHKCVLAAARELDERHSVDVTYLPVDQQGLVSLDQLENAIRPGETALVSIMAVNNEIGVIQPIAKIGEICRRHGVLFHSDAAQAAGKISVDVQAQLVDLLSLSGHKIYGPKGVGALYVRSRKPRVRLLPLLSGGGQERGLRSGTVPAPLVVGMGKACEIAAEEMQNDHEHIAKLAQILEKELTTRLPKVTLNGAPPPDRWIGNLNFSFAAVEGESLLMALKTAALSSGSACTSASLEPSYVLRALGVDEALAHTSLRFGIGRFTTEEEVRTVCDGVVEAVEQLRAMSPLWESDDVAPVWT